MTVTVQPALSLASRIARPTRTNLLLAFISGFIAVLVFHQGVRAALLALGAISVAPYSLSPAPVTGVPRIFARSFWGGVWGIVLALIESRVPRRPAYAYWVTALLFGAIVPSLFAWFIVASVRGEAPAGGGDPARVAVALLTNAVWGLGTAVLYRVLRHIWHRGTSTSRPG